MVTILPGDAAGGKTPVLTVTDISKTFKLSRKQQKLDNSTSKLKTAVDGLSFTLYKGEIFGLLGPNGAEKTTTLRIIATLLSPDSGDVVVDGASVITAPDKVRKKIGFLTSDLKLDGFFTPNYMFDFFSDLYDIDVPARKKRKETLFSYFGIDKYTEVKISDLSTGMRQKVSLAISLVHDPEIIVFDEPTNGLDIMSAKVLTDFLIDARRQGKSILLSTHIFDFANSICDRIGFVINGKLAFCDSMANITADSTLNDKFYAVYEESVGTHEE